MQIIRFACFIGVLGLGLTSCTGASSLGGDGRKTSKEEAGGDEDEETPADEPQQVAGAFLCGVMEEPPPDAGMVRIGCGDVSSVTMHYADGTSDAPALEQAPPGRYKKMFQLLQLKFDTMVAADMVYVDASGKEHQQSVDMAKVRTLPNIERDVLLAFTTAKSFIPGSKGLGTAEAFKNLGGADAACAAAAAGAGFYASSGYFWHALLKSETDAVANQRLIPNLPVKAAAAASEEVAPADFATKGGYAFAWDEFGVEIAETDSVWTGAGADNCSEWSNANAGTASIGNPMAAEDWLESGESHCNVAARLYCLQYYDGNDSGQGL